MNIRTCFRAAVIGLALACLPLTAGAELIDRILAVVDGQIVTLSDARAVLRFNLVPMDVSEDPVAAVLQRLIDRRLMLNEVERYAPPEPSPALIEAGLAAVRARFKDALAFEIALNQTTMSHEEMRRFMRDTARIETYIQQRFSLPFQPSREDALAYYNAHPAEFSVDGVLRPFEAVAGEARARVTERQREPVVREWIDALRRRASISVIYLPARTGS
jgi:hypothetical protein